jgi:hypothetical protein
VSQNVSGEKLLSIWSKRFFLSEQNWKLTKAGVLLSLGLGQRLSIGNLNKEKFVKFPLFLLSPGFSLVMERLAELGPKEIAVINHILTLRPRRWETFIRQILWGPDISEVQKGSPDFTPFIPWMLQAIRLLQVSSLINRLSLCAGIWLRHGDISGFLRYPNWITRWLPQVEDATPSAFLKLSDSICFWASIWYLSHRGNQAETHLLRVLMDSGKKE